MRNVQEIRRAHDTLGGQPSDVPNLWTLPVSIKFDEGAIEQWTLEGMGGFGFRDALFNQNDSKRFVARLYSAHTVRIEARLYDEGYRVFTFDVSGLAPGW